MIFRVIIFAVLTAVIWFGDFYYTNSVQPVAASSVAVQALNGGNAEAENLRVAHQVNNHASLLSAGLTVALFGVCFGDVIVRTYRRGKENW